MNCIFFGHRDTPSSVKPSLIATIKRLSQEGVTHFYVGNNGDFDFLVQGALEELSRENPNIKYDIVLSYLGERAISGNQSATILPEGLEQALPRFAISKRNEWLIKNSTIVVAYVTNTLSNCHKWVEKARKKGAEIINLANEANI